MGRFHQAGGTLEATGSARSIHRGGKAWRALTSMTSGVASITAHFYRIVLLLKQMILLFSIYPNPIDKGQVPALKPSH